MVRTPEVLVAEPGHGGCGGERVLVRDGALALGSPRVPVLVDPDLHHGAAGHSSTELAACRGSSCVALPDAPTARAGEISLAGAGGCYFKCVLLRPQRYQLRVRPHAVQQRAAGAEQRMRCCSKWGDDVGRCALP